MSLIITKNHVVTLAYSVTTPDGDVVDKGEEPLVYLHGGYGDLFPKIEDSLEGNHPLAGFALVFHVTVSDVREATHEEITHGHVHMPGHHH